jgi:hypothetical protein
MRRLRFTLHAAIGSALLVGCLGASAVAPRASDDARRAEDDKKAEESAPDVRAKAPEAQDGGGDRIHGVQVVVKSRATRIPEVKSDDGFPFPDDRGGALLRSLLPPSTRLPADHATGPRRKPPPADLETPRIPLSTPAFDLPHLPPERKRDSLRPRLVTEETILGELTSLVLPQAILFHAADKTRVPSVDVNQPPPLPPLAQPTPDRASLDDATLEASGAAAVAAPLPQRLRPAPFLKMNLPDPFENREPVKLPPLPDEQTTPVTGSPQTPKP